MAPKLAVRDIAFFERPIDFVRPFRFGSVTITKATQIFVRAEIELEDGSMSVGGSSEMMAPKWFDKRPHLSAEESAAELRRALTIARDLYLTRDGFETAFGLHAARIGAQIAACTKEDIPALAAAYGPAEIDKAVLDALLRAVAKNFFDGMAANVPGIDARLTPDLSGDEIATFLASRRRLDRVAVRHTVGMDDKVEGKGGVADPADNAGARYFKLKLGGDPLADTVRLIRIGKELGKLPYDYKVTLDANEQYADLAPLAALVKSLDHDSALQPIAAKLLYIEQPMPREIFRQSPLGALTRRDFIIDEADDSYDAFPAAKALGYRGISSKSCKGIYKSVLNAVRAPKVERGQRKILHHRRRSDLPGRSRRAAGSGARRLDRRYPCRTQRPSLCRWFFRVPDREASVPGGASRPLHPRWRHHQAFDP